MKPPLPRFNSRSLAHTYQSHSSIFTTFGLRSLLMLVAIFFLSSTASQAQQEREEAPDKTLSPYFVVLSDNPEVDNLPLKETSANVNIVGVIADVTVKQVYVNNGKNKLEAIYTFPLSTKAAVYEMQMTIGSRIITAKIEEKKKAKEQYEQAKKEGKRTSLLEQSRPNVFTMNVANIMVGDTIKVEVNYTELLIPEGGQYSFVYPTVVGPRYSKKPKDDASGDDQYVSSPFTKEGVMSTYKFGIDVTIRAGMPLQSVTCGTHKIVTTHPDLNTAHLVLDPSETDGGNRDVIINYSLQGDKISSGVMLYEHGDENFFLMMVQPPKKVLKDDIPPREYIFIVDNSGSMHGFPLSISKTLLRNLLVNLKPTDKFNVVMFSGAASTLSPTSLYATQENTEKAMERIDNLQGGGGTELIQALHQAYDIPKPTDQDMARSFVIVTDGYIDVEKEAFDFIRDNTGTSNFFAIGIGSSVNRYLMEGMAFMGNGETMIINKPENADATAEKFRNYINTPVLTKIKPEFGSFAAYDVEPKSPPDMMAERPIIIFGKYNGKNAGIVTVKGKAGKTAYKQSFDLSQYTPQPTNSAIRYLWARDRIKLLNYYGGGDNEYSRNEDTTIPTQITELGLKYNLMTSHTSFIAVDEQVVTDSTGKLVRVKTPSPLPEGVSNFAVGYAAADLRGGDVGFAGRAKLSSNAFGSLAPSSEQEILADTTSEVADVQPSFPGGQAALDLFIAKNLLYPTVAMHNAVEGTVLVTFIVGKDGSITGVTIKRSVNQDLDKEALRIVGRMPKWIPGTVHGNVENMMVTLPVKFKIHKK